MDYTKLNELKSQYGDYEEVFNSGDYDKAADILMKVLDVIELEYEDKRKAGMLDNDLNVRKSEGTDKIWLCTNHIMEYYIYACYFEPQEEILMPRKHCAGIRWIWIHILGLQNVTNTLI